VLLVGATKITTGVAVHEAFLLEFILTFILVWTVFATAVDSKQGNGQFACFAIGLAVFLCHLTGVPFTGCGINPARSFGSALASGIFTDHWVYWVAPLLGATVASIIYQLAFLTTEMPDFLYVIRCVPGCVCCSDAPYPVQEAMPRQAGARFV
jgi:glycerol uptake facilitator-like aquaporin